MAWLSFGMLTRELRDGELTVGSGADVDWRIATADLMPRHLVVLVRGMDVSVRPAAPECVIVVNETQLRGAPLRLSDGDAIRAGGGTFVFSTSVPTAAPAAMPEPHQAYLIDEERAIAHPLSSRSTPIGRDASNAIVVADPTASRFHAEVRREAGGFVLHSMGSGGTNLNGSAVTAPSLLRDGDVIEIAFMRFRFARHELSGGVRLAAPQSVPQSAMSRRPTLGTERSPVAVDNEADRDVRRIWVVIGVAGILVVAFLAWRTLGR